MIPKAIPNNKLCYETNLCHQQHQLIIACFVAISWEGKDIQEVLNQLCFIDHIVHELHCLHMIRFSQQSWKCKIALFVTELIFQSPMFHFHNYWRKSACPMLYIDWTIPIAVDFCSSNSRHTTCTTAASCQMLQACKMTARFPLQRPKMPSRPTMSRPRWKKPPRNSGLSTRDGYHTISHDATHHPVLKMYLNLGWVSKHPRMENNGPKPALFTIGLAGWRSAVDAPGNMWDAFGKPSQRPVDRQMFFSGI